MTVFEGDASGIAQWHSPGGHLQLGCCQSCTELHYYPRSVCPFCFHPDVHLVAASGQGVVYSYSANPSGPDGPFIIAYVTLDEEVTMLTNLIDCAPADVTIGARVKVTFRERSGVATPMFQLT